LEVLTDRKPRRLLRAVLILAGALDAALIYEP
jgi:hypothetical protein